MAKQLSVDGAWLEVFKAELAPNFLVLGPLLAASDIDYSAGVLSVWVPDGTERLTPPKNLRHSFCRDEEYCGIWEAKCEFFDRHLRRDPCRIVLADTYNDVTYPCIETRWFSTDSAFGSDKKPVCAYITGEDVGVQAYERLMNEACPYPRTLLLTSNPNVVLEPEAHLGAGRRYSQSLSSELSISW